MAPGAPKSLGCSGPGTGLTLCLVGAIHELPLPSRPTRLIVGRVFIPNGYLHGSECRDVAAPRLYTSAFMYCDIARRSTCVARTRSVLSGAGYSTTFAVSTLSRGRSQTCPYNERFYVCAEWGMPLLTSSIVANCFIYSE